MPALFGTLTAIVLALSAWIAYKNQSEYKNQIALRQSEEETFLKEDKNLKEVTEVWKDTVAEKEKTQQENEVLKEEIVSIEAKIASLNDEIAVKEKQKTSLDEEVAVATEEINKIGGVKVLVPKVKGLRADVAELTQSIEDGNAALSNLKQVKLDTEAVIAVNEKRVYNETAGFSQPTLNTTIKTVYSSWGFVTLNGGDIQGVVPGSALAVVRNGETIAKLKVTAVEENRAAADIDKDSVGPDVYLRSGDKVIAIVSSRPVDSEAKEKEQANKVTAN